MLPRSERLARLRNWQSDDFWAMVFARPLAILFLLPIADEPWLTPDRLTHASNLLLLAGVAFIPSDAPGARWAAAILLNLHLVADNMDGTLARYRRAGTAFGSFYDKASDAFGFLVLFAVVGWVAWRRAGRPELAVLALVGAYGLLLTGYMKWVESDQGTRAEHARAVLERPAVAILDRIVRPPPPPEPPSRTARQWSRWAGTAVASIVKLNEVDLYLWVALALIADRLDWFCWFAAVSQMALALAMAVKRGRRVRALDRDRPALLARIEARIAQERGRGD